jgi:hypothetical protein
MISHSKPIKKPKVEQVRRTGIDKYIKADEPES